MITKIISCGMSGAERAALDVARSRPLVEWGGYAISGRLADDGQVDDLYIAQRFSKKGLVEVDDTDYRSVIRRCLIDADGILILRSGRHTQQGKIALSVIQSLLLEEKPRTYITADPWLSWHIHKVLDWLAGQRVRHLVVTGPTQGERNNIYDKSKTFLGDVLSQDFIRSNWGIKPYRNI